MNAPAAYAPVAPAPGWVAVPFGRTLTRADPLACLRDRPPAAGVPRVVPDNAGSHTGKVVKAARPGLARLGVFVSYLPPYSPDLNRIEPVFKQVKRHEMPTRASPFGPTAGRRSGTGSTPIASGWPAEVTKNRG